MIRGMKANDWAQVAGIYNQSIVRGNSTFSTKCPTYEQWDREHLKECRLVCEQDGQVVGWTALSPISSKSAYHGTAEVSIYIDEACQGKHIGTELLNTLSTESEKEGFWSLYSVIFSRNSVSIALHRKCGFREIGYRERVAKDRFGNWQNTTLMERRNGIE